jgi:hypothetical protein
VVLVILERTLPQVWTLHGSDVPALAGHGRDRAVVVADVENLCAAVVRTTTRTKRAYVSFELADMGEAVAFLLGRVFEVLSGYDPSRGRPLHDPYSEGFRAWLHLELSRDLVDYWRSVNGRDGHKKVFDPRPFIRDEEASIGAQLDKLDPVEDAGTARERGLAGAVVGVTRDSPDDRFDGFGWALERRDREEARQVEAVGLGATRPLTRRARVAVERGELAA